MDGNIWLKLAKAGRNVSRRCRVGKVCWSFHSSGLASRATAARSPPAKPVNAGSDGVLNLGTSYVFFEPWEPQLASVTGG